MVILNFIRSIQPKEIYKSRNFMVILNNVTLTLLNAIYKSRNFMVILNRLATAKEKQLSTKVEILW